MWQGVGCLVPTHLPMQVLMRHGRSPGALLGLTVTFLPELPARPPLLRWRFLRTPLALSALLPTHVLSRHKDQRSDGFSLSPAALGGGGGKSLAQPSLLSSPKLYTGHSAHSTTKPPSPSGPSAGACSGAGSLPASLPQPCVLPLGCSPPAAASGEKQPLPTLSSSLVMKCIYW